MSEYRIYMLTPDENIASPPEVISRASDDDALHKAQERVGTTDVELWNGERLVARLPHY